jgi:hypothetical protein
MNDPARQSPKLRPFRIVDRKRALAIGTKIVPLGARHGPSKTRLLLALRPPKLSRSSAKHMTEMTRQMTLVEEAHGERNFR